MARDLIPPASPAGRPNPDGTPNLIELPPEPPRSPAEPAMEATPGPSEFRNRFGFLLGALAGIFVAAVLVLVVVARDGATTVDEGLEANWSAWRPSDTSLEGGAAEIADKVDNEYRHPNGKQLTFVRAGRLEAPVLLRSATGEISVFQDDGVFYELNGLGPNMSIKGGKASPERLQVLKREALELALYTFRYLPEVKMVVAMLPPPPPSNGGDPAVTATQKLLATGSVDSIPKSALFYRPGDLKPQLQVPLGVTVPSKAPTPDSLGKGENEIITALTSSNLFNWSLQEATGYMILDRPTAP